jgi:small subunit ribosomal protein S4
MARYTGPKCKLCRREGTKLYLKGARCASAKCAFERRKFAPGQHGPTARKKITDYGIHLREKQKARRIYGVLEKQFRKYFAFAAKKVGVTGENLMEVLERRLDNIVYRMGFAASRASARQLVRHGHITVNGRKVNIASYSTKPGDIIEVTQARKDSVRFKDILAATDGRRVESWLEVDTNNLKGSVITMPARDQIDTPVNETFIVELYSK